MTKKKIAIIIHRYGAQVNGGAEVHSRKIATHLSANYDITVLTSAAMDYHTWKPELPLGESYEEGIRIIRFDTGKLLTDKQRVHLDRKFRGRHLAQKLYRLFGKPSWWFKLFPQAEVTNEDYFRWLETQGPYMPDLIEYLKEHKNDYSAFIFFQALFFQSAAGIITVPDKAILIPLMHDEKAAYYPFFQKVMASPRWIFFNTEAEQEFCKKLFPIQDVQQKVVAVGVDLPSSKTDRHVLDKYGITSPYLIYLGRVDTFKNCDVLIEYFNRFLTEEKPDVRLVLVGNNFMNAKGSASIILTGFISEEDKEQLLKHAEALIIPSVFESLSLVVLESFASHIPVIANGNTPVLKDHVDLSGGGWNYFDYRDFKKVVQQVLADKEECKRRGEAGYEYAVQNYSWDKVLRNFEEAITDIERHTLQTQTNISKS